MSNQVDKIYAAHKQPQDFAKEYARYLGDLLQKLDFAAVGEMIKVFQRARSEGRRVFFIGNGGSAATASHFANDMSLGPRYKVRPLKAVSLTDNNAVITAIGNDNGYEFIFEKQLEILMEPGDVVVAISASGNSPNIVRGVEYARKKGNFVIGLTGFDGGKLKALSDLAIHVSTAKGEYGPVEDVHMFVDHLIGAFLCQVVAAEG